MKLYEPGRRPDLFKRDAIFLSASEPVLRNIEDGYTAAEVEASKEFLRAAWTVPDQSHRIFDAVTYLCKFAFQRDIDLVFGGHPAISPMVLHVASRFGAVQRRRVVVFQSALYAGKIPQATWDLDDHYAEILWTPQDSTRAESLTRMRDSMLRSVNLIAAVFIGGMDGCEEEYALFRKHREGCPSFPIGSTGGAALKLLRDNISLFQHGRADARLLERELSYPVLMRRIFEDLKHP